MSVEKTVTITDRQAKEIQSLADEKGITFPAALREILDRQFPAPEVRLVGAMDLPPFWASLEE